MVLLEREIDSKINRLVESESERGTVTVSDSGLKSDSYSDDDVSSQTDISVLSLDSPLARRNNNLKEPDDDPGPSLSRKERCAGLLRRGDEVYNHSSSEAPSTHTSGSYGSVCRIQRLCRTANKSGLFDNLVARDMYTIYTHTSFRSRKKRQPMFHECRSRKSKVMEDEDPNVNDASSSAMREAQHRLSQSHGRLVCSNVPKMDIKAIVEQPDVQAKTVVYAPLDSRRNQVRLL